MAMVESTIEAASPAPGGGPQDPQSQATRNTEDVAVGMLTPETYKGKDSEKEASKSLAWVEGRSSDVLANSQPTAIAGKEGGNGSTPSIPVSQWRLRP